MASLLSLIKQAIFSRTQSDVTIHERTFVTELLEAEHKGDPFALYDFFPRKYRGKNLVITRHLIFIFRCIVLLFIGLIYIVYDLIHKIVTGQWKSKRLSPEVLKRRVPNTKWAKRLHADKWRGMPSSTGVNAIIFTFVIIQAILLLVFALNFLIREVVMPDNEASINNKGVVSIDQGALETQHFFLLNSATCWTTSGIAVSKGDRVYISASGSMYSDVGDMSTAVDSNTTLNYPRSLFYMDKISKEKDTLEKDVVCCIYGRCSGDTLDTSNRPYFGSLLYQICDETHGAELYNNKPYDPKKDTVPVNQVDFDKFKTQILADDRFHFEAKTSGILYFSFNDILLDTAMIDKIVKGDVCSKEVRDDMLKMASAKEVEEYSMNKELMGKRIFYKEEEKNLKGKIDSLETINKEKKSNQNDSILIALQIDSLEKKLQICQDTIDSLFLEAQIRWLKDSDHVDDKIWFADNLGEALINVRVERNIWNNDMPLYTKLLVAMYRGVNELWKPTSTTISWWSKPSEDSWSRKVHDWLEKPRHYRLYLAILIVIAYFTLDAIVSSCLKPKKCRTRPRRRRRKQSAEVQE